jgi:hypothetical protein
MATEGWKRPELLQQREGVCKDARHKVGVASAYALETFCAWGPFGPWPTS